MDNKKIVIIALVGAFLLVILLFFLTRNQEQEVLINKVTLEISSNIEGATIYVGEEGPFVTPETMELPPGEYYVWGYRDGYYNIEKQIVLEEDKDVTLDFRKIPEELLEDEDEFHPQFIDPNPY